MLVMVLPESIRTGSHVLFYCDEDLTTVQGTEHLANEENHLRLVFSDQEKETSDQLQSPSYQRKSSSERQQQQK